MLICVSDKDLYCYVVRASSEDLKSLSPSEIHIWNNEKKYRRFGMDWLSGRIAAKLTVKELLERDREQRMSLDSLIVENDSKGAPFISLESSEPIIISIAHSNGVGVAIGSKLIVGLGCDIEIIKNRSPDIYMHYLSNPEQALWRMLESEYNEEILNTAAWASKESAIKCIGSTNLVNDLSLKNLFTQPCQNDSQNFLFSYQNLHGKGTWLIYDNYIISVAILD
jgi:phosphopantetheinyl transferase